MIGLISAAPAGSAACDRLAASWPDRMRVYRAPTTREAVGRAFTECEELICFLGTDTTLQLLVPLLGTRTTAPGVICVDDAHRTVVPLLNGRRGAARTLAREIAEVLPGCRTVPAVTTPVRTGVTVLDSLGWPVEGAVGAVARAFLDGAAVALSNTVQWPLPALPPNVQAVRRASGEKNTPGLWITDQVVPLGAMEAVLRPPSLTVGVGACQGTSTDEIVELIEQALDDAGLSALSIAELVTVDAKAAEPGVRAAANRFGVALRAYPADELAAVGVPNPNPGSRSAAAVGTPSVAEAGALLASGGNGELLVPKVKSESPDGGPAMATAAVARRRPTL